MDWKQNFKEGNELILASCSKANKPNANIVISLGFHDDKLLVADCSMITTIKNLAENPQICVISKYSRLYGKVELHTKAHYFDECVRLVASQDASLKVKHAILITPEEVFDLENVKRII